jgi:hypothetical protein
MGRAAARRRRRRSRVLLPIADPGGLVAAVCRFPWRTPVLLIVGALAVALHLQHWLLPDRGGIRPQVWAAEWIEPPTPSFSAYFRTTLEVPFTPRWSWLEVAAQDYIVFVNGERVASDSNALNASLPLQHQMNDNAQGLTPDAAPIVRAAERRRGYNDEWRLAQMINIAPAVTAGRNVIAVFVQAPDRARFAIRGNIYGLGQSIAIPSTASSWKGTTLSDRIEGRPWFDPAVETNDWLPARSGGVIGDPVYVTEAPGIWMQPLPREAITGPHPEGDLRFRLDIPGSPLIDKQSGWIRLLSVWPYKLFIDDRFVGAGGGMGGAEAWDLSVFLAFSAKHISVRLNPPLDASGQVPLLVVDGQVGEWTFSSATGWQRLVQENSHWLSGGGEWEAARLVPSDLVPTRLTFETPPNPDIVWVLYFVALWVGSAVFLVILNGAVGAILAVFGRDGEHTIWIISIPVFVIALIELLRLRFEETDSILWFLDPANQRALALAGPGLLAATTMLYLLCTAKTTSPALGALARISPPLEAAGPWLVSSGIVAVAFALRFYDLGLEWLQVDENVSWDTARGVLRTGLPEEITGVIYTRSVLFHYPLAAWIALFGDTKSAARAFSATTGVLSVLMSYVLAYRVTGRRSLALIVAFCVACDPWEIHNARNIRFYQQVQFFSLLSMYLFLRGFIEREGNLWQNLFFFSCVGAVLSQEVYVITFPGFCIAGLYFYRPFRWKENINVVVAFAVAMAITLYDMAMFVVLCLTANVGISTSSASIMQLHLFNPTVFFNVMFLGNLRGQYAFSVLFFLGFAIWIRNPKKSIATLYIVVITGVVTVTILVVQIAARYVYLLYPFLMMIAVATADLLLRRIGNYVSGRGPSDGWMRPTWYRIASTLTVAALVVSFEPAKIVQSYGQGINLGHEAAYRFIAEHHRGGDVVITESPMSGAIVLYGVDYYLMDPVAFDELYRQPRGVVDRWAGGVFLSKLEQVQRVLQSHERVWIIVDWVESAKMPMELNEFLESARDVYEFFGGRLLLWDQTGGRLVVSPHRGGAYDDF